MPLQTMTREQIAHQLGSRLARELGLPMVWPRATCGHPQRRRVRADGLCWGCYERRQAWRLPLGRDQRPAAARLPTLHAAAGPAYRIGRATVPGGAW